MTKPKEAVATMPGFDMDTLSATGEQSFAAMTHINARLLQAVVRYNTEVLDFVRHRLKRDMQMSEKLANCKSVGEVIETVDDFYRTAFTEYSEETAALMKLGADVTSTTMDEVGRETSAAMNSDEKKQVKKAS